MGNITIGLLGEVALFAGLFTAVFTKIMLPTLRRLKAQQSILEDAPESHKKKAGTPTMGGMTMVLAMLLSVLMIKDKPSDLFIMFAVTFCFGLIGFLDDYIKVVRKQNLGLKAWQKSALQVVVAAGFAVYQAMAGNGREVFIPFAKIWVNFGVFFIPFVIFVVVGTVNAVNLTDGLDGLASSVTAVAAAAFCVVCYMHAQAGATLYSAMLFGACIGFLVYNWHPAKVFMGDTGSLALGGALSAVAVCTGLEFMLIIIGGVFVWETLSVIIQVAYFKATHGKRIFRMSPFHHHLELCGMKETTIVALMCVIGIVLGVIAVAGA